MKVKICGITTLNDALTAVNAGADALGFVFYPQSPRYIAPEAAAEIITSLPPFVEKVGLFVNEDTESINNISKRSRITLAQLHFDADDLLLDKLKIPYLQVVRARSKKDVFQYSDKYRIIDAYCEEYGGMGKRLNLEWFEDVDCSRIILAGGLSPDNIGHCLNFGFYALDVSSGVEISKGVKDPEKVASFIKKAQNR